MDTTKPYILNLTFSGGNNNAFSPNGDGVFDKMTFNITASENVSFGTIFLFAQNGSKVKRFLTPIDTNPLAREWNGSCVDYCGDNSTPVVPDGEYKIEITMTDRAGNVNATNLSMTIIVDTAPPSLFFVSPTPNNETLAASNSILVNITSSEAAGALLELNGTNWTMNGTDTNWFRINSSLADGNYTFRVYINDSVGNWNVSETRFVYINATRNLTSVIKTINQTLTSHSIKMALLNSTGHETDSNRLLSFMNYTLRFNITGILIETADFLVSSLNTSAVLNITSNLTAEFNISSVFNQSGGILDSYVWIDLNNLLPAGNFTAKITFPRIYALYFYLNGTKDAPNITRVTNACNANINNTPCYNISAAASVLYLPSFSGGAGGNDTQAPSLNVSSIAAVYSSSSIPLNYTVTDNAAVDVCWYSLNGNIKNLSNCTNTTITASEGSNIIIIYANDTSGNLNQTNATFTFTPPATTVATTTAPSGGNGEISSTVRSTTSTTTTITATTIPQTRDDTEGSANQSSDNQTLKPDRTAMQNQTAVITGLVAASPANFVIGGIAVVAIVGAISAYLFLKSKPKRSGLRQINLKRSKKRKN